MEKLFIKDELHKQIDEDGVLTMPFLNPEELQAVKDLYYEMHPEGEIPQMRDGIHMTIWCSDYDYKVKIRERLLEILYPACSRIFKDFRIVGPVFIIKRKGADTTFPIHQDWNVVDETKHRAFNFWFPLHDVDESRGSLWVVKGSHRLPTHVRGPGLLFPDVYPIREHVAPLMEAVNLKAGSAMIFYHRIIHGSPPNKDERPRIVVSFSVLPKDVPLHIFFQKDENSPLNIYHPEDNFIYQFENVRDDTPKIPPEGDLVDQQPPAKHVKVTPEMFDRYYYKSPVKRVLKRLFG